jgi:hypothetical protein
MQSQLPCQQPVLADIQGYKKYLHFFEEFLMNNKTIYSAILGLALFVCQLQAAHLTYDGGQMRGYSLGYVYNATETDPFDDPSTYWRDNKWLEAYDPNVIDIMDNAGISTASWNSHAGYSGILNTGGVTIDFHVDVTAASLTAASGLNVSVGLGTEDYPNGRYGLFYTVASDGEPVGTPVKIHLSWNAQAQVTGLGYAYFYYPPTGDGIIVAVNSNPVDGTPAAESVVYKRSAMYFPDSPQPPQSGTIEFMAAIGDKVGLYLGGTAPIYLDLATGSGDIHGEMTVNMQIVAGRDNPADINKDMKVDLADLAKLAESWLWEAPPPSNQSCDNALLVQSGKVYEDTTVETTNGQLWYQFRPMENARYTISLCGSDFDTRLTVYYRYDDMTDPCPGYYWGENEDFCDVQSQLDLSTWGGTTFYFKVDSSFDQRGHVRLEITKFFRPVNDELETATDAGLDTIYTGSTLGSVNDAYVWYRFTPTDSDFYTLSLCGSSFDTMIRLCDEFYNALDFNDNACDQQSEMPVYLSAGVPYYIAVGSDNNIRGDYQFGITRGAAAPANDECANAIAIYRGDWIENSTAVATGSDISSCGTGDVQDVWYRFTADSSMPYDFQLYIWNSNFDETITLYDATGCPGTEIFCSPTAYSVAHFQRTFTAGQEILIRVGGFAGKSGHYTLYMW